MKDNAKYVVCDEDNDEFFVGDLWSIRHWLEECDLSVNKVFVYRLGAPVRLVLAAEDF